MLCILLPSGGGWLDSHRLFRYNPERVVPYANVAQLVEQLFRKQQVESSSLSIGSTRFGIATRRAEVIQAIASALGLCCDSICDSMLHCPPARPVSAGG